MLKDLCRANITFWKEHPDAAEKLITLIQKHYDEIEPDDITEVLDVVNAFLDKFKEKGENNPSTVM